MAKANTPKVVTVSVTSVSPADPVVETTTDQAATDETPDEPGTDASTAEPAETQPEPEAPPVLLLAHMDAFFCTINGKPVELCPAQDVVMSETDFERLGNSDSDDYLPGSVLTKIGVVTYTGTIAEDGTDNRVMLVDGVPAPRS